MGVAICLTLMPSIARAHEGLHEQILAISARIKRDPKNAALYLQRGELYRLHREWARAAADYDRASRIQPSLTIVDLGRGKMLLESRRFQQARFVLDRFLRQHPKHVEGLVTRGRVLARIGARLEAAKDFTEALAIAPAKEPELYLERAQVLAGDERFIQEALRGLDEGIKQLGPLVTLELAAIDLELRGNNYDAALTRLDKITAQSERKETWLVRRGEILEAAGRKDEAHKAYSDAIVAIESLPPQRRQSRAIMALQLRARSALKL
jgi:predicted Zn-dependent protease